MDASSLHEAPRIDVAPNALSHRPENQDLGLFEENLIREDED